MLMYVSALSVKVCSAIVKFLAKLVGEAVGSSTSSLVSTVRSRQDLRSTVVRRYQLKVHKK